jgi:hypothetical protein
MTLSSTRGTLSGSHQYSAYSHWGALSTQVRALVWVSCVRVVEVEIGLSGEYAWECVNTPLWESGEA